MKGWLVNTFRNMRNDHLVQTETIVSPSDCADCIGYERNIRAAKSSGNVKLAADLRAMLLAHCRRAHLNG